jgi:hypothetical protein
MKQCKAIAKTTGAQCKKRALPGTHYCYIHYPKTQAIITIVIGALLGLFLGVIFSESLSGFLSQSRLFHYLDRDSPKIENIVPSISFNNRVHKETKRFLASISDRGSGLRLSDCNFEIYFKENQSLRLIEGNSNKTDSALELRLERPLQYGEYSVKLSLEDKAGNCVEESLPFIVREENDVEISCTCADYEDSADREIFSFFFQEYKQMAEDLEWHIFNIAISNGTARAMLRDIHLTVDLQLTIFSFKEIGSVKAKKIESYLLAEALDKTLPKGHVFLSQRYLHIEEMAPGGLIHLSILAGRTKTMKEKSQLPRQIDFYGTYTSEGYGTTEVCKLRRAVPIKYQGRGVGG